MLIDWLRFVPALILLLTPIGLFHGSEVRYRGVHHNWVGYWGRTLALKHHAFDFFRALTGAWMLSAAITVKPGAVELARHYPLFTQTAVLCLGITLQVLVCKQRDAAHAPFAYALGLVAGFASPTTAALAILLTLAITYGARLPTGFFLVLAITPSLINLALTGEIYRLSLIMLGGALLLPWLLTWLFPRMLVGSYLARRTAETERSRR